jgi:hypothetical protein
MTEDGLRWFLVLGGRKQHRGSDLGTRWTHGSASRRRDIVQTQRSRVLAEIRTHTWEGKRTTSMARGPCSQRSPATMPAAEMIICRT